MEQSKDTNILVQFLNVFGIILVVLGHSELLAPYLGEGFKFLSRWIYSFHMPLFFLLSGFLFIYTYKSLLERGLRVSIKKKIHRLLVPYLVLGTIVFLIKKTLSFYSESTSSFDLQAYLSGLIYPQRSDSYIGYLWFIGTLFILFSLMFILCFLKIRLNKTGNIVIVIIVSLIASYLLSDVYILNLGAVFKYLVFFGIGMLLCNHQYILDRKTSIVETCFFLIVSVLTVLYCKIIWINALIGIAFSISLGKYLLQFHYVNTFVSQYAVYTYSIYLLHWFAQYIVKIPYVDILHLNNAGIVPLMFIAGVVIPVLVCKIVDKSNNRFGRIVKAIIGR